MSIGFNAIDLDKLPAPNVVEPLDYETILASLKADAISRDPDLADVLALESEPTTILLETAAYRELLLRQRVNEAAKAVMLAYAKSADLDQIAARFEVERLLIDAGDPDAIPPVEPTYEDDDRFRDRVQLSLEGYSTAGPSGSYVFWGLSASPEVKDIGADSPTKGDVFITVLSTTGDGTASQALLDTVDTALNQEDIRPLNDTPVVQSASITNYSISADLTLFAGADADLILQQAQAAVDQYVDDQHRLGRDVVLSGIYAALHQTGVQQVNLTAPVVDLVMAANQAAYCTGITLTIVGTGA